MDTVNVTPIRLLVFIEAATITGPAKNLLQFASLARSRGVSAPPIDVTVVTFARRGAPDLFVRAAHSLSLPVHLIPEAGAFDHSVIGGMRRLAETIQPDVIQSHAVKSHFLVRMAGLHHKAPWIAFHHGYTWPQLRTRIYNQLDRWSLRAASCVLTVSLPFQEELVQMGVRRDRIEVIHNAIDPNWATGSRDRESATALRQQWRLDNADKVILVVGRLSKEKDHVTLLQALKRVVTLRPDIRTRLLVIGDGPERARIEHAATALGLKETVIFTGHLPSVEPYYGIADVVVLSSLSEGSPNALLEAMAAGVPVVATAVGGVPEIATSGENALLTPPGDASALANAIISVLSDETVARRLAEDARKTVIQRHHPVERFRQLSAIYTHVRSLHGRD